MNRRSLLPSLILIAALGLPLIARDAPAVRTLRTRSISFQVDQALPPVFAHSTTGDEAASGIPVKVKSYLNHEVEALQMTGEDLVFTTSPNRGSMTKPGEVLAKVRIPAGIRSAVLMFLPSKGKPGKPKYRILPIEDTGSAFPPGSYKIINLSPRPVRIVLEDRKTYNFESGETKLITDPPVNARNASAMRAFNFADDQWTSIGATSWPNPGKKRVIHVAFLNPLSNKVEFRGIRDIVAPGNEDAAGE